MPTASNTRVLRTIPFLILIYLFSFPEKAGFFRGAGETNVQAATINVPADLPTIQEGINAASNGDTVLVSPGTYVENINFNGKNIVVGSLILTTGDTSYISQTIIDGSQPGNPYDGSVVYFISGEDSTAVLNGFTITGGSGTIEEEYPLGHSFGGGIFLDNNSCPSLINLIVTGNVAQSALGAGICCWNNNNCSIENVIVTGNDGLGSTYTNDGTGGIAISNSSSPTLRNVLIANNTGLLAGGMFCNEDSNPVLINVTIASNQAFGSVNNSEIAEFISWQNSNPILINTIIWNDSLPEIVVRDNAVTISYSDIQGGLNGIITYDNATVNWLDGNIDSEPMFVDPVNMDYRLQAGSPCIDAGDNSVVPRSRFGITDLDGNPRIVNGIVDMGAYEAVVAPITNIYYVDADAAGANDGSSWTDAYNYLQEALLDAEAAEKPVEIWVAQGIYKPSEGLAAIPEFNWRTITFQLINGVTIKGGYAGFGEPDPDERDIDLYKTILSGDLGGDDGPNFANNSENSHHVVTGSRTDATAIFDGFTITGGNSNSLKPYHAGGGIYNQNGSPMLIHCTFSANRAGGGGGMSNEGESNPTLMNCTFTGNSAEFHGGGMYNLLSSPALTNCAFVGNSAPSGGGIQNWNNCSPTLTNCTFTGNMANNGGGIYSNSSSISIVNTILWNDSPDEIYSVNSSITVSYCDIQNDQNPWPGVGNINADPLFVDAEGADGMIGTEDDDLHLSPGSPCINTGDNSAIPESVVTDLDGNPRIVNSIVDMGAYEFSPESDSNLIGWWKFDEGSGNIAYDSSGNGNDGTFNGNPQWVPGHFNYALEFDGSGDWLNCGEDPSLQITDAVTVSAWIKVGAQGIDHKIGGNQDDTNGGYKMTVHNNRVEFEIRTSGNTPILNRNVSGGIVLQQDVWYHVAGVYSQKGNYIRTYVDGNFDRELVTTEALGASPGSFIIGCEPFTVGSYNFNGVIDDIRIYNQALTEGEILRVMEDGEEWPFAFHPEPADGALTPNTWVSLSWSPGGTAVSHDVYFGDNFDDVEAGTKDTFQGNQTATYFVVGSARYPYLVPGVTYYWRVDEIEADGVTIHKGDVWSFSVESDMIDAGLVAYYPMNEGRGTTITDASGNDHDGIAQALPEWVNGPIDYGRALYFDGSDPARMWVNCGTWNPSAGTGQLTIALWVRWDGPISGKWQDIIAKRDYWNEQGAEDMWLIGIGRDVHTIYFYRQGDWPSCGDRVLPIGLWSHVAVTFDGAIMIFYIDGQETGRDEFSFGPKTDSSLNIGAAELGGWGGFHGTLDEIRLYNNVLGPDEIKGLAAHYGAFNPEPAHGATHTESWITLSWSPGVSAISHDVYFGDDRDNVDTGTGETFKGNQTETWFNIGSVRSPILIPGKTYYWRIDEVSVDGTTYKGDIWSFSTESSGPPKGRACFTSETNVCINGALVPISKVSQGQNICGMNKLSKIQEVQEHNGTFECYDILLESGNCLSVAENHYFLAESGQWISLHNLKTAARLKTAKGTVGIINITRRPIPYAGKVFNLKIDGSDQYLVGNDVIVVRDY